MLVFFFNVYYVVSYANSGFKSDMDVYVLVFGMDVMAEETSDSSVFLKPSG